MHLLLFLLYFIFKFQFVFGILTKRQDEWPNNQLIESQGRIAMARIPLAGNSTIVFMFQQMETRLEANIFFDSPAADGACLSWGIGFPQIVDGTNDCYFMRGPVCRDSIFPDVCESGFSNISACGAFYTITGMGMEQYNPQTHINLFNFHTNVMSLGPSRQHNILLKSIMVVYATKNNPVQQIACSNVVLGKGSETNFTIKASDASNKAVHKYELALFLAPILYFIGI
ncbi:hypothetical protein F4703DRAFT_1871655 [Phycomyces blakesleeanus]